jgi:DNA (cytosine-5)-methyltransferase 1
MHQAGAAITKWAIEYWKPAADAFQLNNPEARVYNGNCNVLLHRAMVKAGLAAQCDASEVCVSESEALEDALVDTLPVPGEVDFICGGPPCQVCFRRGMPETGILGKIVDSKISEC